MRKAYRKYTSKSSQEHDIKSIAIMLIIYLASIGIGIPTLQYILTIIFKINISRKNIKRIIIEGGKNAERISHNADLIVGENARILEIDTSWKGKKHKLLGVIEKTSKYVFCAEPIKNETEQTLTPIFRKINQLCFNTAIVITDLAKSFTSIIPSIFNTAQHFLCRVHTKRIINRLIAPVRQSRRKKQRIVTKTQSQMNTAKFWIKRHQKKRYNSKYQLKKKLLKKNRIAQKLGIPLNSKSQSIFRSAGIPPILKKYSQLINKLKTAIDRAERQENKQRLKYHRLWLLQSRNLNELNNKIGAHLAMSKIKKHFWRLMDCTDPTEFQSAKDKLKKLISGKTDTLSKKILEWMADGLRMCVGTTLPADLGISIREITTNSIENFFGKTRLLMDQMRGLRLTELYHSRFKILRCLWNFHGCLTHFNPDDSPARRLGYKGDCWGCLERICKGLEVFI